MKKFTRSILLYCLSAIFLLGIKVNLLGQDSRESEIRSLAQAYESGEAQNQDSIVQLLASNIEHLLETRDAGSAIFKNLVQDPHFQISIWQSDPQHWTTYSFRYDNFGYLNYVVENYISAQKEIGNRIIFADRAAAFGLTQFAVLGDDKALLIGRSDDMSYSTNFAQVYQLQKNGSLQIQKAFSGQRELKYTVWTNVEGGRENQKEIIFDQGKMEISFVEKLTDGQLKTVHSAKYKAGKFNILSLDEREME
jgi:hypothetical protein